jgi:hypothetical protein
MKYDNMETIRDAFNEIYESEIEAYDNKEQFDEDLAKHGCISGIVGSLMCYSDTTELFDNFEDECNDWLEESTEETGLNPFELFPNWDVAINSACNKNIIIWAMFEDYVATMETE